MKKQHKKPVAIENHHDKCEFGCGQIAKYMLGSGKIICNSSSNKCPVQVQKNSVGAQKSYSDGSRTPSKLLYESLPQETKDRMNWNKNNFSKTEFVLNGKGNHKKALINERGHSCESCGLSKWLDQIITLELDHIDGNNKNNVKDNLKLLCPNCHSLTHTWRGRNINTGLLKVSDDELIKALSESTSIRQALIKVGLSPKGGNYVRCNDLIHGGLVKLANTSGLSPDASA